MDVYAFVFVRRWNVQLAALKARILLTILSREKRLALEHLCKDTARTPDVHFHIILLPCEHDLGSSVVSRRDISGHLRILDTRKTKVANLQIAVLVDEDVGGLEVSVHDASGVDVFQATLDPSV